MKDFEENNCRLCKKVYCCKQCREGHEKQVHRIHPTCDICIYGTAILLSASASLVDHIKTVHWPLFCVVCKRLFGSIDELFQHNKCPLGTRIIGDLEKSPYTPGHSLFAGQSYDSPPLINYLHDEGLSKNLKVISNLATSTPMQREDIHLLEKIQLVIVTPVDSESTNKVSIIKKNQQDNTGSLKKRRVTFGDTTEQTDTPYSQSQNKRSNMSTNASDMNPTGETCSMISGNYYSAKEEQSSPFDNHQKDIPEEKLNLPKIQIQTIQMESPRTKEDVQEISESDDKSINNEDTVWTSALNKLSSCIEETDSPGGMPSATPDPKHFCTPMIPNHKKKQVNVVMPTPLGIKEEISIKFQGPIQISSTPNSSIIPVQSAPNRRDIFRNDDSLPSTSKSNADTLDSTTSKNQQQLRLLPSETRDCFESIIEETAEVSNSSNSADNSLHGRLWSSVSRIVKNVANALNGFSSVDGIAVKKSSLKRHFSDYDCPEGPSIKRYKLTEIKCRRTIRELPLTFLSREMHSLERKQEIHINIEGESSKTFVDKGTQTDIIDFSQMDN